LTPIFETVWSVLKTIINQAQPKAVGTHH